MYIFSSNKFEDLNEMDNFLGKYTLTKVNINANKTPHKQEFSRVLNQDDPEGWDGEGGGRGIQDGEHMYTHG